jgi:hypothetical protein
MIFFLTEERKEGREGWKERGKRKERKKIGKVSGEMEMGWIDRLSSVNKVKLSSVILLNKPEWNNATEVGTLNMEFSGKLQPVRTKTCKYRSASILLIKRKQKLNQTGLCKNVTKKDR